MSSAVTYEAGERIARIALDDGKVNAMSLGFFEALGAALDRAERERPGAVIITGRPGVFSAGLDLKLLPTLGAAELRTTLITFARTMLRVFLFPIPTVAAVGGQPRPQPADPAPLPRYGRHRRANRSARMRSKK